MSDGVKVTATSASGNVQAKAGERQVPEVRLRYRALAGYDERKLGAEISTTVASAMRGYRQALQQRWEAEVARFPETADEVGERYDRIDAELSGLDIRERTPHGHVMIAWRGHHDIEVRLKPGSLGAANGDLRAVEDEVNTGLRQVTEQHARRSLRIRCDINSSYLNRRGRI